MDFLACHVIEACATIGVHGFKVAFLISGQVVNSPLEELLSMLMLLYVDDLVLLAPNSAILKTALEELERVIRKWGMVINYPKTEAMVVGLPAATAPIQVGSNSVVVRPQFKYSAGRRGAGQGAPEEAVLSRAGLQIPQGNSDLLQESRAELQSQVLQVPGAAAAHVRCSGVLGLHRRTGGSTGDLPQWLPESDIGPPPWPSGPSTAELLASGQTSMADLPRRHGVRWLGHAARKPNDVMVKQLLFAHSIPGHPRPIGRPHLTWMDTAMHDMGSLGHTLPIVPRDWANIALYRDVWRGVVSRC